MIRMKYFILFIFLPFYVFCQNAQTKNILPKILPGSPEQAAFAKYGNYEVNLFSGLPDISIPLYEIKVGELSVPISISYHASGNKVNDWGGWVGLGWSLNAGGSITRKMMGKPDEYYSGGYLSGQTVKNPSEINTNTDAGLEYLHLINNGTNDCEPDIFSYNFPGKSGKFIFNQKDNFNPIPIPFDPIKINFNNSNKSFSTIDESGTTYKFDIQEETKVSSGGILSEGTSSWPLTKMISSNTQDAINFSYTDRRLVQVNYDISDYIILSDNCSTGPQVYYSDEGIGYTANNSIYVSEQIINKIEFKNGKVEFIEDATNRTDGFAGQKGLNSIRIYNFDAATGLYKLLKTITFNHIYSSTSGDPLMQSRFMLESVSISDNIGNKVEEYKFAYNTNPLPPRDSRMRDYWGYFNNKNNTLLVPEMTGIPFQSTVNSIGSTITLSSGNNRDPDPAYMQAAILKTIYFPTGGRTDFEYETNKYIDNQNAIKYAGGLRVKSIKSYDGVNPNPIVKSYVYGLNESGYGRPNFILNNYFFTTTQTQRFISQNEGEICSTLKGTKRVRTYLSNPSIEIEPFDGAPVAYPTVTEYIGDGTNNTGKTIYTFRDHADGLSSAAGTGKPIITSYHFDRGQLLTKNIYKKRPDGNFQVLATTANTYNYNSTDFEEKWYTALGLVVFKNTVTDAQYYGGQVESDVALGVENSCVTDQNSYYYSFYSIRSDDNKLVNSSETTYDENDETKFVTNTTDYYYDNFAHQQLTRVITTNSKAETLTSERKYPPDFPGIEPYSTMSALNILDQVVQEKNTKNTTTPLTLTKTNFLDQNNTNYLPVSIDYQLGSNAPETKATFNNYDVNGNILEMQKADDVKSSFQWGYNKMYPVAELINASNSFHEINTVINNVSTNNISTKSSTWTADQYGYFTWVTTESFTTTRTGDILIKLGYTGGGNYSILVNTTGDLASNNFTISSGNGCSGNTVATFTGKPAGTYNITITAKSNVGVFSLCGQIDYPTTTVQTTSSGVTEFFYNGFEDDATASVATPCAGKRYKTGDYTVAFTKPNTRVYYVSYHYLEGGVWKPITKVFQNSMVLTEGDAIDEVRVFPQDAEMVTYTYEPLIGMTSKCDLNNHLIFYEYDNYGRLTIIRDEDKNILKKIGYKYTGTAASIGMTACNDASGGNCILLDQNNFNVKKCINGSCESGVRVNDYTTIRANGTWNCYYHYHWSVGADSQGFSEINAIPCDF